MSDMKIFTAEEREKLFTQCGAKLKVLQLPHQMKVRL